MLKASLIGSNNLVKTPGFRAILIFAPYAIALQIIPRLDSIRASSRIALLFQVEAALLIALFIQSAFVKQKFFQAFSCLILGLGLFSYTRPFSPRLDLEASLTELRKRIPSASIKGSILAHADSKKDPELQSLLQINAMQKGYFLQGGIADGALILRMTCSWLLVIV